MFLLFLFLGVLSVCLKDTLRCSSQQDLPEKVKFGKVLNYTKQHMESPRGKNLPGKGNSEGKGTKARTSWVSSTKGKCPPKEAGSGPEGLVGHEKKPRLDSEEDGDV